MAAVEIKLHLSLVVTCCLVSGYVGQLTSTKGGHQGHKHSDHELDVVQCQHTFYQIDQRSGRQELVSGSESRVDPSRQYLPLPGSPKPTSEEAPAATFEQPKFLSLERTLVSPSVQNNFKSLFQSKPDSIAPAAAQNVPSNSLPPAEVRKISSNKHSHEDDENNLERLCNDAFHSFLCKPIKGPRKTPTGRIRPNAIIPPGVLAGLSSNQEVTKVRPQQPQPQNSVNKVNYYLPKPATTTVKPPTLPPQFTQRLNFPQKLSTTQKTTTTEVPFENIYKPDLPSPTNNNPSFAKPDQPNEVPYNSAAQTNGYIYKKPSFPFPPQTGNPSNPDPQVISTPRPTYPTTRPPTKQPSTPGYSYDKPIIPFASNNIAQFSTFPKVSKTHDCENNKKTYSPFIANPSNDNPSFLIPSTSTSKPTTYPNKPTSYSSNNANTYKLITPKFTTQKPVPTTECNKHPHSAFGKPTNSFSSFSRSTLPPTLKPNVITLSEKPKIPEASNNIAQILAQPQNVNIVSAAPQTPSGYFYEKPTIPFPPPPPVGNPSIQNPNLKQRPTQKPNYQTTTASNGYVYDQPKLPFASNDFPQVVAKPTTKPSQVTPCQHETPRTPSLLISSTNQNQDVLKPASTNNGYNYQNTIRPFEEAARPSNEDSVSLKPFIASTPKPFSGCSYDKPKTPFLLPSPTNNSPNIVASPANNGYQYQKPNTFKPVSTVQPKPSNEYLYEQPRIPFPSNIKPIVALPTTDEPSLIANPQTQVQVTVEPGYEYDKPSNPLTPQDTNQDTEFQGYSYPKPAVPFIR